MLKTDFSWRAEGAVSSIIVSLFIAVAVLLLQPWFLKRNLTQSARAKTFHHVRRNVSISISLNSGPRRPLDYFMMPLVHVCFMNV